MFLEENFSRLTNPDHHERRKQEAKGAKGKPAGGGLDPNQQKSVLFAVCETLNSVVVSPPQTSRARKELLQLRCQALSTLTVILVTCNAHSAHKRVVSSFVRVLLGIIARVRSQSDRQLRLVACESLKVLEHEYPEESFVVANHVLSHCESETTFAIQGYLGLLAATARKLVNRDGRKQTRGTEPSVGEIEKAVPPPAA